jgi:hypothetical protein
MTPVYQEGYLGEGVFYRDVYLALTRTPRRYNYNPRGDIKVTDFTRAELGGHPKKARWPPLDLLLADD